MDTKFYKEVQYQIEEFGSKYRYVYLVNGSIYRGRYIFDTRDAAEEIVKESIEIALSILNQPKQQ